MPKALCQHWIVLETQSLWLICLRDVFYCIGIESEGEELFDFGLEGGAVLGTGQTDVGFLAVLEEE